MQLASRRHEQALIRSVITAIFVLGSSCLQPAFAQDQPIPTPAAPVDQQAVPPAPGQAQSDAAPEPNVPPVQQMQQMMSQVPPQAPMQSLPPSLPDAQISPPPSRPVVGHVPLTYEQSKEVMLQSAPRAPDPTDEENEAFNNMMRQNMPLTPQQVVRLRQLIDTSQRAAAIPATIPPKPVSTTLMINLAPGATPPAIRLAQGYVTSLVFVDSTGSPWPIASYDSGDPKANNIQWDGKSNVLLIQAISPYSESNFVVRLVGLPTPVTLELVSGQRVVDYRTDIHVSGIGPNSKDLPLGTGLPESASQLLLSVLDGVAPAGSKQLTVKGGDCQAWLLGDKMYLRTRFTVLSPGWVGKMVSPDGMYAYEIPKSSSVLISQYGQPVEIKVEGF